ncbi:MAG: hypothetical protein JW986_10195 [Methanotrichaceae archaeon]|nr:hypothetical protein [Methanotrichaceae archaeon]
MIDGSISRTPAHRHIDLSRLLLAPSVFTLQDILSSNVVVLDLHKGLLPKARRIPNDMNLGLR